MKKSRPPRSTETKTQVKPSSRGPAEPQVLPAEKPEIVKEEHPLVPRLRAAIGCPVDWEKHAPQFPYLWKDLRIVWAQMAEQFETCGEMRFYER